MKLIISNWILVVVLVASSRPAVAADPIHDEQLARIDRAILAGTTYLVKQQEADGTWRSKTYGLLKDGTSLTPLAVWALSNEGADRVARDHAFTTMSNWFAADRGQSRLVGELQYPVYAAGLVLPVLSHLETENTSSQIDAWTRLIRTLQLNEENGWSFDDVEYGGWGYSHNPPRKPEPGSAISPLDEPNLSATVFALQGLATGDPDGHLFHASRQAALIFVSRCQNRRHSDVTDQPRGPSTDSTFNDGGFHFMHHDPVRNKPGIAGIDSLGETRFVSYGSATADGLRGLILCGIKPTESTVIAARQWLLDHFEDGSHPGAYPDDRSSLRPSLDYYYAASVASVFQTIRIPDEHPLGQAEWAMRLSQRLISRQQDNGSWSNPAVDVREDDPLVATPLALRSLQLCREELRHN